MRRWARSTAWKARFSRAIQRGRAARSASSFDRTFWAWRSAGGRAAGGAAGRTTWRRGAVMSGPREDLDLDAAVLERLLADGVALLTGLQLGLLHGVELQEAVQVGLLAPAAPVVVVAHRTGGGVDDHGVVP